MKRVRTGFGALATLVFGALVSIASASGEGRTENSNEAMSSGFEIDWWSMQGGADVAKSARFELRGILGQTGAGQVRGGEFALEGGFLAIERLGDLFEDGFESGDLSRWSQVQGAGKTAGERHELDFKLRSVRNSHTSR